MYIQYNMNQTSLPLELSTCIHHNHIVFSIYDFVDSLDEHYFEIFETQDGRPVYHLKPIIMSLLYAYSKGIFSGRKIEEIQPMVDAGIQYDEELELDESILEEITELIEEVEKLTEDIEENPIKGPDQRKQVRRRLKKHHRKVSQDFLPRKRKYKKHFETFNGRNSYSKTDTDATFMRMKDDHMMNGQLKAGYNIQIGTENQFVLHYDVFPNPTDTRTLKPFIESFPYLPKRIVADAGYGSEENLTYLNEKKIDHLIKDNRFDKDQKKKHKLSDKNLENWLYDDVENTFTHPEGTVYYHSYQSKRKNKMSGYVSQVEVYKPTNPENAPQKALYYNEKYQTLKNIETKKLLSKEGSAIFAQRKIDVEPVFG